MKKNYIVASVKYPKQKGDTGDERDIGRNRPARAGPGACIGAGADGGSTISDEAS